MIGKKINQLATELAPVSTDLTIIGDPTTGVSKKITLAQLGAIFSGAVAFYTNLASFPATGSTDIIYCAKDTQKLYLWSGSAYTEVFPSQALLDTYQLRSEKGVSNGYASLDSTGKVPISQLPSSIMEYKGTWSAATNTPTLANGTGDTGDVYICNVAGTVNFGAGPLTFAVGDYVIYSGTIWQRSSGAVGTVTSVGLSTNGNSITIGSSPVTTSGTISANFVGNSTQYINGAGNLTTFPTLTGYVPYTGATANVDLGTHTLSAKDLVINHSSGSGVAASITKGGAGEALTVVKSSGSGNAASITGGVTLLDELHLNTDLADAYIASASNWNDAYNLRHNAVTLGTANGLSLSTQVLSLALASGSTTGALSSTDWNTFNNKQSALTNPVTGTGTTNTLPKFTGASTIGNSNVTDTGSLITLGSNSFVNGSLGIGTGSLTGFNLRVSKNITGATNAYAIRQDGTIQSDVIASGTSFYSQPSTQAASFNLTSLFHYVADQGTIGAGSTITNQYGFTVGSSMVGATNTFAFRSAIAAGTNRWNLYMDGTATNYLAGSLGIGSTSLTNSSLNVSKTITGSTTSIGIIQGGAVQSGVTSTAYGFYNSAITAAAAFTLGTYIHYGSDQSTIGAGSAITTQIGFNAAATLIGATNNYGFQGSIPAGTNRWNLYMNGTANNYMAGALGIGTTSLVGTNLYINKSITGSAVFSSILQDGAIQSDVTTRASYNRTAATTAAASFTLTTLNHYQAFQGTFGAGSTVTNQNGFNVDATLIGATNNYGFRGSIPAQANAWNLYMDGTANNYLAGNLGIGNTSVDSSMLRISRAFTSTISTSIFLDSQVSSTNSSAIYFTTRANTQAATFTTQIRHISLTQDTFGAGSTVTDQYGIIVGNLTGATNNYGFFGNISAAANRWNLYIGGTANNYLAGALGIGNTSLTGFNLRVEKSITGATAFSNIYSAGVIQSDVTSSVNYFRTAASTQATTFTLGSLFHFSAVQGTLGAGSSVTDQYGFFVDSSLIGATNDYGFYGNIASGTGRWNLFMNGTAANYLNGDTAIGTTTLGTATKFTLGGSETASSAIARGQLLNTTLVAAANYDTLVGLDISPTFTNGSFIGVNNYALRLNAASGSFVWNLYASGTADNYMAGNVGIGTTLPSHRLSVIAPFASGVGGAYIEAGEFNKSIMTLNHTNGSVNVNLFEVQKSGTNVFLVNSSGNVEIATGSIKTGAPTGGTAQPWKLGTVYTGTCVPSTFGEFGTWFTGTVIEIEVNGTTYKIPAVIDNYC